jgi:predicted unusual protein kinase regulating ubiquinone biosynthesis (AarF/ABC1/UbiB family)
MGDDDDVRIPEHLRPLFDERTAPESLKGLLRRKAVEKLSTSRVGRAFELGRLAVRGGSKMIASKVRAEAEHAAQIALASEMLRTFSEMRGVTMKLGQMLSYLDDALPPEARKVLAALQRDVPPMAWSAVSRHIEEDLGRPAGDLFASIEQTPMAAASIGQVHRAVLFDGTRVAVKVQYPGIESAMKADIQNAQFLSLFQRMMFFRTDTKAIMAELEERFMDECDYTKEAAYQEAYRARFLGHPYIVVPRVHGELSGRRVLTTTLEDGKTFYQWLATDPSPEERARVTALFYRFYLGSFYMDGLFNCDPHPGNYLFRDDGRIVFLDYGCSRRYPEERRAKWIELCRCVYEDDLERLEALAVEIGFVEAGTPYDVAAFRALMRYLYQPYLSDEPFDFRDHRPEDTFRRMFVDNPNLFRLDMPADAVFLNRIGFGLVSLLAEVGSSLNCRRYATSYFSGIDPDWPEDPFRRSPG